MKIPMVIIKLLFLGALFMISNYDLHLADTEEREIFFDLYASWFSTLTDQGAEITGYVVNFEWLPDKDLPTGKVS